MKKFMYILIISIAIFYACDDPIAVNLTNSPDALVVDAWLNNLSGKQQIIFLSKSQPYFDVSVPKVALGATVEVVDNKGKVFTFSDNRDGSYIWNPPSGESFGTIGNTYNLTVIFQNDTFTAVSEMRRVPPIDSITFMRNTPGDPNSHFKAQCWARDLLGVGDTYMILSGRVIFEFINQIFLRLPGDPQIAYDGGMSKGSNFDNLVFIPPIRTLSSRFYDKDSIFVEIHSITEPAFNYLNQVDIQASSRGGGGFGAIFDVPLANVPCNINKQDPNSKTIVLGFFSVSAVSSRGKRLVASDYPI